MDSSKEFDSYIRDLDERLERIARQNEVTNMQDEIASLEQKLFKLQQDSIYEDKYRSHVPEPKPRAEYQTSSQLHDTKPKQLQNWTSPIESHTPDHEDNPEWFVTRRKKVNFDWTH